MTSPWRHISQEKAQYEHSILFLVYLPYLMVSTSPKVKDNKRMVNVFLASVPFWISEGEQAGVVHNPWPILLLRASWAKVINGKKNDRCSWPGRCESLIMEGFFKHPLGDIAAFHKLPNRNFNQYRKVELLQVCVQVYLQTSLERSTWLTVFEKCHFKITELVKYQLAILNI